MIRCVDLMFIGRQEHSDDDLDSDDGGDAVQSRGSDRGGGGGGMGLAPSVSIMMIQVFFRACT